jgi:hypothetical protein
VGEHQHAGSRVLHYVGALAALACVVHAALTGTLLSLACAPLVGYAFAWLGHACLEHNRPATWGWPWWSLRAELRMLRLACTGRMRGEVARAVASRAVGASARAE